MSVVIAVVSVGSKMSRTAAGVTTDSAGVGEASDVVVKERVGSKEGGVEDGRGWRR
jgi:hypothetical protein